MAINTNSDVADRVRGIAAERRVSRAEIASVLSVSPMAISRRLNGITPFNAEELIKLARRMNTPIAAFFESTPAESSSWDSAGVSFCDGDAA